MSKLLAVASGLCLAAHSGAQPSCDQTDGDYPGCGVSKSTYSASDPIAGKTFLQKYFPVQVPSDECSGDICYCSATDDHAAWEIQQGRVYTTREISPTGGGHAGNGFGMHLVNVSAHSTTGGLSTQEVEAHFVSKLGDMSSFDSFMDFNVAFATSNLQGYKDTFDADGVQYLAGEWSDSDGSDYTSILVHVPNTQLILELVQQTTLNYNAKVRPVRLEQRVPSSTLSAKRDKLTVASDVGSNLVSLVVNRAVSLGTLAKLEDFYVSGMGTEMTHDATSDDTTKKCFLWPGATVHVCFTSRPDSATSGSWKVGDFEKMLNTVHTNIIKGYPFCPMDKWEDNHYAIDSSSADTAGILRYVNENSPFHICTAGNFGQGASMHYVFDPTGWGIQLDLGSTSLTPDDCASSSSYYYYFSSSESLQANSNPACDLDTSTCPSGLASFSSVMV